MLVLCVLMVLEDDVDFPDVKPTLDTPSNFKNRLAVGGTAHPDGNLVSLAPDVDDRTVDKLSVVLSKSFPDQQEEHFHPEVVEVKTPHVSIQTDQPPPSVLVVWVLPHGLDALLEKAVVGPDLEFGGNLDVVVQRPEVLNSVEVDHGLLVGLPALAFVILVEPQCPSVLQWMFHL